MKTQEKKKKEKNEIKVRDLKPKKDTKGGLNFAGPSQLQGRQGSPSRMPTAVE